MTQKEILLKVIGDEWIKECMFSKTNTPYGYLGSSSDRRVRELVESGQLESMRVGKYAYVRKLQNS